MKTIKSATKLIPQVFLDILFWFMFALYMTGGIHISGKLKLSYLNDIWIAIAGIFLILRIFTAFRFDHLTFGRAFLETIQIVSTKHTVQSKLSRLAPLNWLVLIGAIWFSILFFVLPHFSYYHFGNSTYDLGIFDNVIWNGAHSGTFFTWLLTHGNQAIHYFPNNHLNFGLAFFALLYKIKATTSWLFLFQSAALYFSIVPLYKLSDKILPVGIPRWWIILMYALWDPIHRINTWDFHEAPFIIFFSLWSLYFFEVKNLKASFLFGILTAIWKEDAWWVFSGIMFYSALKTPYKIRYLFAGLIGLCVLPIHAEYFNLINQLSQRYGYLGSNIKEAVGIVAHKPWVLIEALIANHMFLVRLFLSSGLGIFMFGGTAIIPTLVPLLEIALSTDPGMLGWQNHYVGHFTGPLFFSTLYGVRFLYNSLKSLKLKELIIPVSAAVALTQLYFNEAGAFRMTLNKVQQTRCFNRALSIIPSDAKVIAGDPVSTHLTHRAWITLPEKNRDLTVATWFVDHNDTFIKGDSQWEVLPFQCDHLYIARRHSR